ncbi:MAG: hypothetical protein ACTSSA_06325 [Candidatus Freyarchaeota archaeon]
MREKSKIKVVPVFGYGTLKLEDSVRSEQVGERKPGVSRTAISVREMVMGA